MERCQKHYLSRVKAVGLGRGSLNNAVALEVSAHTPWSWAKGLEVGSSLRVGKLPVAEKMLRLCSTHQPVVVKILSKEET